jgi:hypothetical protein
VVVHARTEHRFSWWHQGVMLFDRTYDWSELLPLPPGEWRARWSGFGERAAEEREYTQRSEAEPRPDRYLLQLWPLRSPGPVVIVRGY